jgi:hypothetical protein
MSRHTDWATLLYRGDVAPCSPLKDNRHFRGTCRDEEQTKQESSMKQLRSGALIHKREVTYSSGTSVGSQRTALRHTCIPEGRILHFFIGLLTFILVNKKWFPEVNVSFNVCSPISIGMEPIFDYFLFSVIPLFLSNSKVLTVTSSSERCPFVTAHLQKSTSEATSRTSLSIDKLTAHM